MAIDIDKSAATRLLHESYKRCLNSPVRTCLIKDAIDFVLNSDNCLTYRYILLTNLLAKAIDSRIDILSLQAGDSSNGAFDARSLASKVVYPFQKTILGNVLDGANNDPLVNKPGRYLRLDKSNAAAKGKPMEALHLLCDNLVRVESEDTACNCIDYIISALIDKKVVLDAQQIILEQASNKLSVFQIRHFLNDLLNQGFGGASLVLTATALYHLLYIGDEFRIEPHPVNQSGTSKHQFSDLDVICNDLPFIGTELKDKPFSDSDVDRAASTAHKAGAKSLIFVAGRQSTFASQPSTYFDKAREDYEKKGMYVGVVSIDSLIDIALSKNMELNAGHIVGVVRETAEKIGALEAQMWVYQYMSKYMDELF